MLQYFHTAEAFGVAGMQEANGIVLYLINKACAGSYPQVAIRIHFHALDPTSTNAVAEIEKAIDLVIDAKNGVARSSPHVRALTPERVKIVRLKLGDILAAKALEAGAIKPE
jgi:hypothetical protein